jgi:outer membrane protein
MRVMKRILLTAVCSICAISSFAQTYTLNEYETFALQNSKTVKISQERIQQAENLRQAAFTQFLPSFQAVGSYTWNQKDISLISSDAMLPVGSKTASGTFGFTADQISNSWTVVNGVTMPVDANGNAFNPYTNPEKIQWKQYALLPKSSLTSDIKNVFVGGIGFTQPIFMGNKVRELYNISKSNEEITKLAHNNEEENLVLEVDQSYWTTVSLINKKKLAQKYVDLLEKLCKDVQAAKDQGVATKGDLLNVRVKLNEANLALTRATDGVELSKMSLFRVCGLDLNGDFGLADEDVSPENAKELEAGYDVNQAIDNRSEIRQLEELVKISKSNVNIARSRFMPNILATGNYITTNPNSYNGYETKFGGMFTAGVAVTVPIFHFGDRTYTLRAAKHEYNIANYRIDQAKELINLQVTQANFNVKEANKKLESALSNISAAEENLKLANISYKEGLISVTDLLAAQTAWVSAQSDKIDAGINARMTELYLRKAVGITNIKEGQRAKDDGAIKEGPVKMIKETPEKTVKSANEKTDKPAAEKTKRNKN